MHLQLLPKCSAHPVALLGGQRGGPATLSQLPVQVLPAGPLKGCPAGLNSKGAAVRSSMRDNFQGWLFAAFAQAVTLTWTKT